MYLQTSENKLIDDSYLAALKIIDLIYGANNIGEPTGDDVHFTVTNDQLELIGNLAETIRDNLKNV